MFRKVERSVWEFFNVLEVWKFAWVTLVLRNVYEFVRDFYFFIEKTF